MKILSRILAKVTSRTAKKERTVITPGDEEMNLVLQQLRKIHSSTDEQKRQLKLEAAIHHLAARVDHMVNAVIATQQMLVEQQTVFEELLYSLEASNIQLEFVDESDILEQTECHQDEDYVNTYGSRILKKNELN
jgi:spore coat protein CotF